MVDNKPNVSLVPTETIALGGVDFHAKCTARTFLLYKEKTGGQSLIAEVMRLEGTPDHETALDVYGKLVWAMIAHNENAPTLDDVYDFLPLNPDELSGMAEKVMNLFSRSMPQAKGAPVPPKAAKSARR